MKKINNRMFYMDTINSRTQSLYFIKSVKAYRSLQRYKQELDNIIKDILSIEKLSHEKRTTT